MAAWLDLGQWEPQEMAADEVEGALGGEEFAVDLKIFLEHFEAFFQLIAGNFALLDVNFFEE